MIQRAKLFLLTLVHFLTDFYSSLVPPLLPLLVTRMDISLTLAGVLGGVSSMTSSLVQPLMGILGDRMQKRYFIIIGPLLAAVFMSSVGLAPTYGILVVLIILGGFGTASFHPQSVSMAGEVSGNRRGLGVSLFIGGGTLGLGVSPLAATWFVSRYGLENLIWLAAPAVIAITAMARVIPIRNTGRRMIRLADLKESFRPNLKPMILLTVVVVLRTLTGIGFSTFLALLMKERGFDLMAGGYVLTLFMMTGVVGGLIGGVVSDRIGRARVIWTSILLSTPFLYGFLHTEGVTMYVLLGIGGFLNMASNSVSIALAQELVPNNAGTASSFPMGFSWGVAGGAVILVGNMADRIGVESTLEMLAFLPIIAALLALKLPADPRAVEAATTDATAPPALTPAEEGR